MNNINPRASPLRRLAIPAAVLLATVTLAACDTGDDDCTSSAPPPAQFQVAPGDGQFMPIRGGSRGRSGGGKSKSKRKTKKTEPHSGGHVVHDNGDCDDD